MYQTKDKNNLAFCFCRVVEVINFSNRKRLRFYLFDLSILKYTSKHLLKCVIQSTVIIDYKSSQLLQAYVFVKK